MLKFKKILIFIRDPIIPATYKVKNDVGDFGYYNIPSVYDFFNEDYPKTIIELTKLISYGSSFVFMKDDGFKKIIAKEEEENIWKNPELYFKEARNEYGQKNKTARGLGSFLRRNR